MADQVADLPPLESSLLRSDVADQVADLLPPTNGNFRFLL